MCLRAKFSFLALKATLMYAQEGHRDGRVKLGGSKNDFGHSLNELSILNLVVIFNLHYSLVPFVAGKGLLGFAKAS